MALHFVLHGANHLGAFQLISALSKYDVLYAMGAIL